MFVSELSLALLTRSPPAISTPSRFPTGENGVSDPDHKQQMQQLEDKIAAVKQAQEPGPRVEEHYSQAQHAWRMVIELVAGLGIGFGMGYGLDSLFGTLPIFMMIFTILGLVAGVKTMIRSAAEIQEQQLAHEAANNDAGLSRNDEEPEDGK
jgi:ATP synthase protein I